VPFSIDTNILVYAIDPADPGKHARARTLVDRAMYADCTLSLQVIGEFFVTSRRMQPHASQMLSKLALDWLSIFVSVAPGPADVERAITEARDGRHHYWDALLLATLREAGCTVLLSEDMQHGADYDGVRVLNPFLGDGLDPEIEALLDVD